MTKNVLRFLYSTDFFIFKLECCGVKCPEDWILFMPVPPTTTDVYTTDDYRNETGSGFPEDGTDVDFPYNSLPQSCCSDYEIYDQCSNFFTTGCFDRMRFIIGQSAMLIATGATAVAFVQVNSLMCL